MQFKGNGTGLEVAAGPFNKNLCYNKNLIFHSTFNCFMTITLYLYIFSSILMFLVYTYAYIEVYKY